MNMPITVQVANLQAKPETKLQIHNKVKTKSFGKTLDLTTRSLQQTEPKPKSAAPAQSVNKLPEGTTSATNPQTTASVINQQTTASVINQQTTASAVNPPPTTEVKQLNLPKQMETKQEKPVNEMTTQQPWAAVLLNLLQLFAQMAEVPNTEGQLSGTTNEQVDLVGLTAASELTGNSKLTAEQTAVLTSLLQTLQGAVAALNQTGSLPQTVELLGLDRQITVTELSELTELLTSLSLPPIKGQNQNQNNIALTAQSNSQAQVTTNPQLSTTAKLPEQLKSLMNQLMQGEVTVEAAATSLVQNPNMLEQIGMLAKLVKMATGQLQQTQSKADLPLVTDETGEQSTIPAQATTSTAGPTPLAPTEPFDKLQVNLKYQLGTAKNVHQQAAEVKGEDSKAKPSKPEVTIPSTPRLLETPISLNDLILPITTNPKFVELQETINQVKAQTTARELVQHVVFKQIVSESQMLVGRDHSEVRIQLKPEFLGKLSLEIAVEHGVVKAEILAESQQVKQLLEANLANLKQTLTNQGLKVDQLVVNLGQGQMQFGQAKEQSSQFNRNSKKAKLIEEEFEVTAINTEYGAHLEENQQVDYKI